jgi:hypothetical protein
MVRYVPRPREGSELRDCRSREAAVATARRAWRAQMIEQATTAGLIYIIVREQGEQGAEPRLRLDLEFSVTPLPGETSPRAQPEA